MRGKVGKCRYSDWSCGITPAYAGKSCSVLLSTPSERGSPPPMRGKVGGGMRFKFPFGITPAYAGKRFSTGWTNLFQRDHPRLCGEKPQILPKLLHVLGSPPPMRGKEVFADAKVTPYGITPAYAGKSSGTRYHHQGARDHPRLCGEKASTLNRLPRS